MTMLARNLAQAKIIANVAHALHISEMDAAEIVIPIFTRLVPKEY